MFPFKKSLLSLLCWMVLLVVSTPYAEGRAKPADDVLRVLAIGNSFSQDAVEQYLHELAAAAGKKMVIGNLYIGGAPLKLHVENVQANKPAYSYRKIDVDGNKTKTDKTSILTALQDEAWDYISFQQASTFSGVYDTYAASLPALYQYVKNQVSANTKYILHQTWAYAGNSTHKGFANYNNDQITMYKSIVKTTKKARKLVPIDLLIPSGTAIQNARTSFLGDSLTRDGYHLDLNIGRYTAACTWFESLFNESVITNTYRPAAVSEAAAVVARHAAHAAVRRPFAITHMKAYKKEPVIAVIYRTEVPAA